MDVNVMKQRCRVLRTASDDIDTGGGLIITWEELGFTAGEIIPFVQLGEGNSMTKYGIGRTLSGNFIYHGEAEVLKA